MKVLFLILLFSCTQKGDEVKTTPQKKQVIEKEFASFITINGKVEKKSKNELVWESAVQGTPLFIEDWIKTLSGSQCLVNLNSKAEIKMDENSVLILLESLIEESIDREFLAFESGNLELKGNKATKDYEVVVKTRGGWISLNQKKEEAPKKIQISYKENKQVEVKSIEGEVRVLWENKESLIKAGESQDLKIADLKVDYKENPPSKFLENKKVSRTFGINSHRGGEIVDAKNIKIIGVLPSEGEVYFKGEKVKGGLNGKFSLKITLERGINNLTFQIIVNKKVTYQTLEIIRK